MLGARNSVGLAEALESGVAIRLLISGWLGRNWACIAPLWGVGFRRGADGIELDGGGRRRDGFEWKLSPPAYLDPDTLQGVEEIASRSQIEKEAVILQALRDYLEVERWRGEHIRESIRQAYTGEFADDERIDGIFSRWES